MTDETRARADQTADQAQEHSAEPRDGNLTADPSFPTEPFPCPHCGQMLASNVRVCVACRQPINARQIAASAAPPPLAVPEPPPVRPSARFSWEAFLAVLAAWLTAALVTMAALGPEKAQWVMMSVVVLSSAWVFYDAHEKAIPRPLYWGIGCLLLWIIFFPWYLSRRRQPQAACPFMEVDTGFSFRMLLWLLLIVIVLGVILASVRGPHPR